MRLHAECLAENRWSQHVGWRALCVHASARQHHQPIADTRRQPQVVRNDECAAALRREVAHHAQHVDAMTQVEESRGLIEQQPARILGESPSKEDQLALAAGERVDAAIGEIHDPHTLERCVREHKAERGMVVIQDPWTGEILAMANWPIFDPDRPDLYSMDSRKNRAITDQFEPGSTFKLVTAAAALTMGSADLGSVYYAGRGKHDYGFFTIHDVKEHGWMDFEHAFAKSSNVRREKRIELKPTTS